MRRIFDQALYAHFVTFSVANRRQLLNLNTPRQIVLGTLNHQLTQRSAKCMGFVIMPDHVHTLVWFAEVGQLSRFMHEWKRSSSLNLQKWYREHAPQVLIQAGQPQRFWQPKYYSFEIEKREKLEEKLIYMHMNPVRARLVKHAVDWKWSSALWYESRKSVGVPIEWVDCD